MHPISFFLFSAARVPGEFGGTCPLSWRLYINNILKIKLFNFRGALPPFIEACELRPPRRTRSGALLRKEKENNKQTSKYTTKDIHT